MNSPRKSISKRETTMTRRSALISMLVLVTVMPGFRPAAEAQSTAFLPEPVTTSDGRPSTLPNLSSDSVSLRAPADALNVELVGQIGGASYAVAISGTLAYLGVGPRLIVLDVSDPTSPSVLGQTEHFPSIVHHIAIDGSIAYVANWEGGLRIVDISDPGGSRRTGLFHDAAVCRRRGGIRQLCIRKRFKQSARDRRE